MCASVSCYLCGEECETDDLRSVSVDVPDNTQLVCTMCIGDYEMAVYEVEENDEV